ncbi:SAM-dependent methyltransferase [Bacillus mycoides]|nr:SAM-dependent methyltransferase [Bacillus mycoides]OFE03102.1 SAM-dependent methyltransferase [Bacillus mycoides]
MSINFHDANNKYTYANRNAHISWQETINNIVDVQNKQVIDIGCGGGIYTKELALMGAKNVVGLDFSKEILQAAKENCNAFPNISFIHGDAHNIPYPNESFDLVISRAVIHHLQDVPTFIREASRI